MLFTEVFIAFADSVSIPRDSLDVLLEAYKKNVTSTTNDRQVILVYLYIALAGAFGGLVFGTQSGKLQIPGRNPQNPKEYNLGILTNIFVGIGGAITVFLLVPGEFSFDYKTPFTFIKSFATAFIGGYGGYALLTKVLNKTLGELKEDIENKKKQDDIDAQAQNEVEDFLTAIMDPDEFEDTKVQINDWIRKASATGRMAIYKRTKEFRRLHWKSQKNNEMKRVIIIMEQLKEVTHKNNEKYFQILGHLGYAYKDLKNEAAVNDSSNYTTAKGYLNEAIVARDKLGVKGHRMYEFSRAVCNIRLEQEYEEQTPSTEANRKLILVDLHKAYDESSFVKDVIENMGPDDVVRLWLSRNHALAEFGLS